MALNVKIKPISLFGWYPIFKSKNRTLVVIPKIKHLKQNKWFTNELWDIEDGTGPIWKLGHKILHNLDLDTDEITNFYQKYNIMFIEWTQKEILESWYMETYKRNFEFIQNM